MSKKSIQEVAAILRVPIADKHIKPHPTKTYLSVIKPMAVIERLNEAFGIGGWQTEVHQVDQIRVEIKKGKNDRNYSEFGAACRMIFRVPAYDISIEQFGGSTNEDVGDALKGAATDALTKIASYLGVAWEIYMGEKDGDRGGSSARSSGAPASDKQRFLVQKMMDEKGIAGGSLLKLQTALADPTWPAKTASETIEWLLKQPNKVTA